MLTAQIVNSANAISTVELLLYFLYPGKTVFNSFHFLQLFFSVFPRNSRVSCKRFRGDQLANGLRHDEALLRELPPAREGLPGAQGDLALKGVGALLRQHVLHRDLAPDLLESEGKKSSMSLCQFGCFHIKKGLQENI